jgi:hypothetical protein
MNRSNYDMATPINSLQQPSNNINNLVRNVENNIETIGNINSNVPQPVNLTYNPTIGHQYVHQPTLVPNYQPPTVVKQEHLEIPVGLEKKSLYQTLLVNSKEYLIMILLFSLLAHKKVSRLFIMYIPGLNTIDSPIPSLIIRGVVFTILSGLVKQCV